jgi:hypothetical protein
VATQQFEPARVLRGEWAGSEAIVITPSTPTLSIVLVIKSPIDLSPFADTAKISALSLAASNASCWMR